MIDCEAAAGRFFAAAAEAPTKTHAARALSPLAVSLRKTLLSPLGDEEPAAMLRTVELPSLTGGEGPADIASRLEFRLSELWLAKRCGDAADVRRIADLIVRELREAALAKVGR